MTHFVTSVLSEGLPEKYVHFALLLNTFIISMTHCRLLLPVCLAETTNYRVDEIIPSNVMQNYFTEKKRKANWNVYSKENKEQHYLEEFPQIRLDTMCQVKMEISCLHKLMRISVYLLCHMLKAMLVEKYRKI